MDGSSFEGMDINEGESKSGGLFLEGPTLIVYVLFVALALFYYFGEGTFWTALLSMILFVVSGFFVAKAADMFRRWLAPSMVFTSGGVKGLLKAKVFWMVGPQVISLFVCLTLCGGLFLKTKKDVEFEKRAEKRQENKINLVGALRKQVQKNNFVKFSSDLENLVRSKIDYPSKPQKNDLETVEQYEARNSEWVKTCEELKSEYLESIGVPEGTYILKKNIEVSSPSATYSIDAEKLVFSLRSREYYQTMGIVFISIYGMEIDSFKESASTFFCSLKSGAAKKILGSSGEASFYDLFKNATFDYVFEVRKNKSDGYGYYSPSEVANLRVVGVIIRK